LEEEEENQVFLDQSQL